jgi:hypothetical protein
MMIGDRASVGAPGLAETMDRGRVAERGRSTGSALARVLGRASCRMRRSTVGSGQRGGVATAWRVVEPCPAAGLAIVRRLGEGGVDPFGCDDAWSC